MIRSLISTTKTISNIVISRPFLLQNADRTQPSLVSTTFQRYFSVFRPKIEASLLESSVLSPISYNGSVRTVTKYSMRKGKRKSVKTVLRRFYRLDWGIWIRRIAGYNKKLWRKSPPRKRRMRQHVFCNATQSRMLDKMVGSFWRRPKYYVDDPYEPYHNREEFQFTYKNPRPYFPPEQS